MSVVVSCEDIAGMEALEAIYNSIYAGESNPPVPFYKFIIDNTAERSAFLEQHCDYSYVKAGSTIVLKIKPKVQ